MQLGIPSKDEMALIQFQSMVANAFDTCWEEHTAKKWMAIDYSPLQRKKQNIML